MENRKKRAAMIVAPTFHREEAWAFYDRMGLSAMEEIMD
jgi:hypothetical protein